MHNLLISNNLKLLLNDANWLKPLTTTLVSKLMPGILILFLLILLQGCASRPVAVPCPTQAPVPENLLIPEVEPALKSISFLTTNRYASALKISEIPWENATLKLMELPPGHLLFKSQAHQQLNNMNKLALLRAHLLSIPDELKIEPDDLMVFADNGKIVSSADGTNKHFEYRYNANIIITNYSGNPDLLTFWLLQWMEVNQPDHNSEPVDFDADIINNDSVDFSLTLALTETVKVEESAEGIKLFHADDPNNNPILLDAADWTLSANGDPVADWVQNG